MIPDPDSLIEQNAGTTRTNDLRGVLCWPRLKSWKLHSRLQVELRCWTNNDPMSSDAI